MSVVPQKLVKSKRNDYLILILNQIIIVLSMKIFSNCVNVPRIDYIKLINILNLK
jgi:hypothetical protein